MTDEPPIPLDEARRRRRGGKGAARDAVLTAAPAAARPAEAEVSAADGEGGRLVMTEAGLQRLRGDRKALTISGPFEVATETLDEESHLWGLLIRFRDRNGTLCSVIVTRDMFMGEKSDVATLLGGRGLYILPGRGSAAALNIYLATLASSARARIVGRTGWHLVETSRVFVMPRETIGTPPIEIIYHDDLTDPPPFAASGTVEEWNAAVADRCIGNSRLILALCCAFAAPLLDLLGEQGGGFHLFNKSSSGKTTVLRVAASVWGGEPGAGAGAYVRQWRATGNGMEGLARSHSDALLAMDEISTADPASLADTIYMIGNGRGRERLDRSGRPRRAVKFRSLVLSTGEPSFADRIAETAKNRRAGQEVRMIDLPADAGAGHGVFNVLHEASSGEAFALELRAATERHYGAAAPVFLRYLTASAAGEPDFIANAEAWITDLARGWLAACPAPDGQVTRAARRFALLAVAGELAVRAGVLDWTPGDATDGLATCFQDWLTARGTTGAREDADAVAQLRAFILAHGKSRFEQWPEPRHESQAQSMDPDGLPGDHVPVVNRAGWRRFLPDPAGSRSWRYFITAGAGGGMREALRGLDFNQATRTLSAGGYLIADTQGKTSRVFRVGGHGVQRLYEVSPTLFTAVD